MQPSIFNVRVPIPERGEVFLMNTLSDAQLVVSADVAALLDRLATSPDTAVGDREHDALETLFEHGFVVSDRESERHALERYLAEYRDDTSHLRITVLPTLQCNLACEYCFQGDHGDYNARAARMSLETASRVARWIEGRLEQVRPDTLTLTFFGGEPLMNLPVVYVLADRASEMTRTRGVRLTISLITNGLLLTPEIVDRLAAYGPTSVKITLDGDRETHDRMRPLRGGQGTFDRIVQNVGAVAGRARVSIGGNFDQSSAGSYPALLDFLKSQDFSGKVARVDFKPIIRGNGKGSAVPPALTASGSGSPGSICPAGGASLCDACNLADETMAFLREETRRHGFQTADGVHMGPCEIHKRHAYTIGPDGSLYACPGFTGQPSLSIGHVDGRREDWRESAADRFDHLAPWEQCGDCSFIPVCAGGCSVASQTELGDMNAPTCHKRSFESALVSLAHQAASTA